jgi:hypothetical protein
VFYEEPGYPDGPDPSVRTIYQSPAGTIFIYGGPAGGGSNNPVTGRQPNRSDYLAVAS